jgi:hypothetical protein
MLVAALEAFHEEVDIGRLSSTLPRGTTAGQNRRTYRDLVVGDEDPVISQGDPPSCVKKQVPSVRDIAAQVDQPKHAPVKVPLGQPSGTSSVKTTAMQADLPQRSPRVDDPQQTKDMSRNDHLQAPKEALDARNQQSTAQDKIYVMVQPMPAPGTAGTPYFIGQDVSQFIEQYERLCTRYHVASIEKHQGLPEYCDYWIGMWIRSLPEFTAGDWTELVRKLRAEYRADDYYRRMETRDFVEAFVRISAEQPGDLRDYMQDFTTISAKAVAAGNLTEQEKGWWFMQGLPIEYHRYAIEQTGAVVDKPSTLVFERLKKVVELRIMAAENAERMNTLPKEDALNIQLVQELRQQRNKLDRQREGRLSNLARPGIHGGALAQQQSPTTGQSIVQSPAPGYEDWQNSTRPSQDLRPPQDSRYPQGSQYPQGSRYPQGSQYPQDSTAFGRPQRDARGQQGTRGQGRRTCSGCGGSHRFTEHECQGLKDLIQQGFVHLSDRGRLVAGTRERPGPVLPWLGNEGRLKGIKDWLRTYQGIDLAINWKRKGKEQTQQRAFYDGAVLEISNEKSMNWGDYY